MEKVEIIQPDSFQPENHFYPKVLNAQIHPLISYFLTMSKEALITRYCHLYPKVSKETLKKILMYSPQSLKWAGTDLFYVTTSSGQRKMVVIETNSCPSGQKSMPLLYTQQDQGGYRRLIDEVFLPSLKSKRLPSGKFAVLYDKNYMEASGYAATLADSTKEEVLLVPVYDTSMIRFVNDVLQVLSNKKWQPIKAALRYVTQTPWGKIPITTKTVIFNPILGCLAGGRNKLIAAKAYDFFNSELTGTGLKIISPETIYDVSKEEIPLWIERFGGHAVVKIPYTNAGQGVYTITNKRELDEFMKLDFQYKQFIVQSLIGNSDWSSQGKEGKLFHVGTIPTKNGEIYVADLRMMIGATHEGFSPIALYSRRAMSPLVNSLQSSVHSWDILGTNLSVYRGEHKWDTDINRLLMMDVKDYNKLGIGIDDLIEGYIQTVLAVIAIDKMASKLLTKNSKFRIKLFKSLNNDPNLIKEILADQS